jgi:hypothetical protein
MGESARYQSTLRLREHWLCLELCNATVDWRASEQPVEHLRCYCDLVSWGRQVWLLAPEASTKLDRLAVEEPKGAGDALSRPVSLREVRYRIFAQIAHRRPPLRAMSRH